MYLIVNADDFGYSDPRDDGILECYRHGAVTDVSLMVNGQSATRAVEKANLAGLPIGLHLNITEGYPVAKEKHKTLVNDKGVFLGKFGLRQAVQAGNISLNEVEAEIQAQIDMFVQLTGYQPVSVDGHQHVHVVQGICEVFAEVLQRNNIRMTRLPLEAGINKHEWETDQKEAFMSDLVHKSRQALKVFNQHGLGAASFVGLRTMGRDMSADHLKACILEASSGQEANSLSEHAGHPILKAKGHESASTVVELMTHPGNMTRTDGGCGDGPDWFSQSPDREHEMTVLMSNEMKEFYRDNHIRLVAFKDCELASV